MRTSSCWSYNVISSVLVVQYENKEVQIQHYLYLAYVRIVIDPYIISVNTVTAVKTLITRYVWAKSTHCNQFNRSSTQVTLSAYFIEKVLRLLI